MIADKKGRKQVFFWGMVAQSVLYTILMFTQHFYVMLTTIFLFGALASIRQITGFVYFLELIPKKYNTAAACVFFVIDGLTYFIVALYFWVISTHWFYVILVGYLMQLTGTSLICLLPESPVYQFSLNRVDDTLNTYKKIASINKTEL